MTRNQAIIAYAELFREVPLYLINDKEDEQVIALIEKAIRQKKTIEELLGVQ